MHAADLKPRTVGELLDAAFFIYRRRFARLALATLVLCLPSIVVAVLYASQAAAAMRTYETTLESLRENTDPSAQMQRLLSAFGGLLPMTTIAFVLQTAARSAVAVAMAFVAQAALSREEPTTLGALMRAALPRIFPAALLQIAFDVSWNFCACCCPPVGIVLGVLVAPAIAAVSLERGPAESGLLASVRGKSALRVLAWPIVVLAASMDALRRSVSLSWWRPAVGRGTLLVGALLAFLAIADGATSGAVNLAASESGAWFWAQHLSEALVLPVVGLGRALWYFDLRCRREGIDL